MSTRCNNCLRLVLQPIEHEFCAFRELPYKQMSFELLRRLLWAAMGRLPRQHYVAPTTQQPIRNNLVPSKARPGTGLHDGRLRANNLRQYEGETEDGQLALNRKIVEDT